ncbi:MAG: response regulator [Anaerolineaceae bacterium]
MAEIKDHILIVEDSDITLYKIKAVLIRLGYDVTAYNNPVTALEWLANSPLLPDLILLDVVMPQMDGYEFLRRVRGQEKTQKIPIILLTSHVDTRDKIEGLEAGADDYLGKSASLTELELRVKALLARKHATNNSITQISARSIAVFSLKGGVGVSSLAVNLSIAISQLWGIETCLWDMVMGVGQCALMMNLKPISTIATLSDWTEQIVDESILRSMLLKHDSGIWLMPDAPGVEESELINTHIVDLVWPVVQTLSPYLIIDAGNHFSDPTLSILERADIILLVLAPELASVNASYQAIKVFNDLGFPAGKILPVVNHTMASSSLEVTKIAAGLKRQIIAEIPHDSKGMVKSINQGVPYIITNPKSDTSYAISNLAYRLSSSEMETKKADLSNPILDGIRKGTRR